MKQDQIRYFLALSREQDWARAAQACAVSEQELVRVLKAVESDYGCALFKPGGGLLALRQRGTRSWHKSMLYRALLGRWSSALDMVKESCGGFFVGASLCLTQTPM